MEAEASGAPPEGIAHEVLRKQSALIGLQIASERTGLALKLLTAAAGIVVAAGLAWALWDAAHATGTVILPFDSAPPLEAQGLTGSAIAKDVLGRVLAMQSIVPLDQPRQEASSTADQINVVIPQTGVSIGEAQRLLRGWLGHETHVSGALRPTANGDLELLLRMNGRRVLVPTPPQDQRGSADAWLDAAAEAALREADPYRYAVWLAQFDARRGEAFAVIHRLTRTGTQTDRAWAWTSLGTTLKGNGDFAEAIVAYRMSLSLNPSQDTAALGLGDVYRRLGREEPARTWFEAALHRANPKDHARIAIRRTWTAAWSNDWLGVVQATRLVMAATRWGQPSPAGLAWPAGDGTARLAKAFVRLHEPGAARATFGDLDPLANETNLAAQAEVLSSEGRWADLDAVLGEAWRLDRVVLAGQLPTWDRTLRWPWQAYVAARLGRIDDAQALIARTPLDCGLCVRTRARVAELAGRRGEADRWFAEAVRLGPSLATAEQAWGEAKLARGDAAGALALAQRAEAKAPRWADPKKLEGDALLRVNQPAEAAKTYAEAAVLAPRWGGLHLAWGEALAKLGKAEAARAKWTAASGMDLTAAERAELQEMTRKRTH